MGRGSGRYHIIRWNVTLPIIHISKGGRLSALYSPLALVSIHQGYGPPFESDSESFPQQLLMISQRISYMTSKTGEETIASNNRVMHLADKLPPLNSLGGRLIA